VGFHGDSSAGWTRAERNCQAPTAYSVALSDWDFDLDIAAWLGPIQGNNNPINVMAQHRPLGISEDDDGDFPAHPRSIASTTTWALSAWRSGAGVL